MKDYLDPLNLQRFKWQESESTLSKNLNVYSLAYLPSLFACCVGVLLLHWPKWTMVCDVKKTVFHCIPIPYVATLVSYVLTIHMYLPPISHQMSFLSLKGHNPFIWIFAMQFNMSKSHNNHDSWNLRNSIYIWNNILGIL